MLLFIIIPVIISAIKKKKIKPIFLCADLYPLFIAELVHVFFQLCAWNGNYSFVKYAQYLQYAFILVLLIPILRRKLYKEALIGSGCVVVGTVLNKIVIAANNGKMPVLPSLSKLTGFYEEGSLSAGIDSLHILMTSETHLNFLGDYIDTGFCIMSVGDLFIHAFVSIIMLYTIYYLDKKETTSPEQIK